MKRSAEKPVRPSPARVDAVFDEIARREEQFEADVEATATERVEQNAASRSAFTRTDKTPRSTVSFSMTSAAPRVFAPPQVK